MDSVRFILAIVLCMAIMVGWSILFRPQKPPQKPVPEAKQVAEKKSPPLKTEKKTEEKPLALQEPEVQEPEKITKIHSRGEQPGETPLLELEVTSSGGISEVQLPRYKSRDAKGPEILIPKEPDRPLPLGLWMGMEKYDPEKHSDLMNWKLETPAGDSVVLRREVDGIAVQKEIKTAVGRYHVELQLTFENRSPEERQFQYRLRGPGGLTSEALRAAGSDLNYIYGERGPQGETVNEVETVGSIKQKEKPSQNEKRIVLAGSSNNYFAAVLASDDPKTLGKLYKAHFTFIPDPQNAREFARKEFAGGSLEELDNIQREEVEKKAFRNVLTSVSSQPITMKPGEGFTHHFILFMGPREAKILAEYPQFNLTEINDYGMLTFFIKIFIQILKGFHFVLFSWGLAIFGLTFLVRLCLHPLNRKQQASMMRYQKKVSAIKPQLDALKERYGSNRMKMNQEMQKLFKEHGVNPTQMMGGCLMIFFQLPVWIALYRSIEFSLDLRQASFLWITDLTKPDGLLTLPFTIPFLGNLLNVLPIIYVILTILQQKLQPKPADPQMQQQMRMMTYMMVFFGFIFYSFPAGFLLYFIASAAISMVESRIIKRILAREGLGPPGAAGQQPATSPSSPGPSRPQALYPGKKPRGEKRKKR